MPNGEVEMDLRSERRRAYLTAAAYNLLVELAHNEINIAQRYTHRDETCISMIVKIFSWITGQEGKLVMSLALVSIALISFLSAHRLKQAHELGKTLAAGLTILSLVAFLHMALPTLAKCFS